MGELSIGRGSLQTLGGCTGSASIFAICIMLRILKHWGGGLQPFSTIGSATYARYNYAKRHLFTFFVSIESIYLYYHFIRPLQGMHMTLWYLIMGVKLSCIIIMTVKDHYT